MHGSMRTTSNIKTGRRSTSRQSGMSSTGTRLRSGSAMPSCVFYKFIVHLFDVVQIAVGPQTLAQILTALPQIPIRTTKQMEDNPTEQLKRLQLPANTVRLILLFIDNTFTTAMLWELAYQPAKLHTTTPLVACVSSSSIRTLARNNSHSELILQQCDSENPNFMFPTA
jgi:hypothetical protein